MSTGLCIVGLCLNNNRLYDDNSPYLELQRETALLKSSFLRANLRRLVWRPSRPGSSSSPSLATATYGFHSCTLSMEPVQEACADQHLRPRSSTKRLRSKLQLVVRASQYMPITTKEANLVICRSC